MIDTKKNIDYAMINERLSAVVGYLMVFGMNIYLVKLVYYSPVYYIIGISLLVSVLYLPFLNRLTLSKDVVLAMFLLVYVILSQYEYILGGATINIIISLGAYIVLRVLKKHIGIKKMLTYIDVAVIVALILLFIDTIYRFMYPYIPDSALYNLFSSKNIEFYYYKYNSFMFGDSNSVGLCAMIMLFLLLALSKIEYKNQRRDYVFMFLLLTILIMSLSRASIIALLFGVILYKYWEKNKVLILFVAFFAVYVLYFILLNDLSYKTKIGLIDIVKLFVLNSDNYELLFGIGLGESKEIFIRGSHSLFVTYFVEMGVFGLSLAMSFYITYMIRYGVYILVPVFIAGVSFFLYAGTPFLFVPLALFANIVDEKRNSESFVSRCKTR